MHVKTERTIFWTVLLFASWLCLEAFSLLAYRVLDHTLFSYPRARGRLDAAISASAPMGSLHGVSGLRWVGNFVEVLNPYFGFVADPSENDPALHISKFGFLEGDQASPILKRSPGKVIVAPFGGSFSRLAYPALKSVFDQQSAGLGKKFVFVNFAADGYKQPQQLMVLNFFLALGAEFDLVINLDGFNAIALPPAENIPYHVNPFYPRKWDRRTIRAIDPTALRLIGSAEASRTARESWAQTFKNNHLFISPTLFLIWQTRDKTLARAVYETSLRIKEEGDKGRSYTMTGPSYTFKDQNQLYHDLAEVWKRCSMQMNTLCAANGAKYYDFLQPNQYVEGSKPMSEEERSQAVNPESRFAAGAVNGYPFLEQAGREMQVAGVRFTDLTMVFARHEELLYIDDCCHTNRAGYDIVAKRIYETVYPK